MKESIRIIQGEHRSMSAVLHGLKELTEMARASTGQPDWRAFHAMIRYIDEYPERFHHPKEDRYLFARLMLRCPAGRDLVLRLEDDHQESKRLVRELERALILYEDRWPEGADEFAAAVHKYCRFHWDHMRTEERELIPLAEMHLTIEDWGYVDAGFAGNTDPIAAMEERNFRELFTRLVNLAPAPVGLAEPWEKTA